MTTSRRARRTRPIAVAVALLAAAAATFGSGAAPAGAAVARPPASTGSSHAPAFRPVHALPRPARLLGGTSVKDLHAQAASVPAAPDRAPVAGTVRHARLDTYQLLVTTDTPTVADYNYWALGVSLTIEGLPGYYATTIVDRAANGHAEVLGQGIAEPDGSLTIRVRYPDWDAALGKHTIEATNLQGYQGSTTITVDRWSGWASPGTATPNRMTREQFVRTPIVVGGKGFTAGEQLDLVMFDPDGNATPLTGSRPLAARSDGSFGYVLKAVSAGLTPGRYQVVMIGHDSGHAVMSTFFLLLDGNDHRVGTVTVAPKVVTVARMNKASSAKNAGVGYTVSGLPAFALTDIVLRDANGQDYYLGRGRANGNGMFRSSVVGSNAVAGHYRLLVTNSLTNDYAGGGTFTVTENDGSLPPQPAIKLSRTSISQIDLMDPDRGVRITASGYIPGQVVQLFVKDPYHRDMSTAPITTVVRHADAAGRVAYDLQAYKRPAVGRWDVTVSGWLYGSVIQRASLEVTR